jgi:large conductance mechanosensitive channel
MKKFLAEFKEFALRGNVIDLAVGVIIGAAFQNIVTALTDNIISPLLGLFANTNFDSLGLEVMGVNIQYGAFITAVINFVIMALILFLLIKAMNSLTSIGHSDEPTAPTTKICPFCKSEIPIDATRCGHCTSQLEDAPAE